MSSPASSVEPPTPVSPTASESPAVNAPAAAATQQQQPPKRKPNRRANTAERRATHNAVERQRRETLNGRFLDLAALLPNLATVRRPSKSAIVNSSIAIIHAHRRRITTSSRALRAMKQESDALRRELNEWRARASLPRVDEPVRGDEFDQLLMVDEDWENSAQEERRAYEMIANDTTTDEDDPLFAPEDYKSVVVQQQVAAAAAAAQHQHQQHQQAQAQAAAAAAAAAMLMPRNSFESQFDPSVTSPDADKVAAWNAQLYSALAQQQHHHVQHQQHQQQQHAQQQQQQQAQAASPHHQWSTPPPFTPTSQFMPTPTSASYHGRLGGPHMFGVEDDASSVGSSEHSAGSSPHTSYELAPAPPGSAGGFPSSSGVDVAPRRPSISIPGAPSTAPGWHAPQQQQTLRTPVSAVGGGGVSFHPMAWMM